MRNPDNKIYVVGDIDKLKDNAYRAIEYGTNCVMLNAYTSGFGAMKMLAEDTQHDSSTTQVAVEHDTPGTPDVRR